MFNNQFHNQALTPKGHYGKTGVSAISVGHPAYYGVTGINGIGDTPSAGNTQIDIPLYPGLGGPAIGRFADVSTSVGDWIGANFNWVIAGTALLLFAVLLPKRR